MELMIYAIHIQILNRQQRNTNFIARFCDGMLSVYSVAQQLLHTGLVLQPSHVSTIVLLHEAMLLPQLYNT